MDRRSAPVSVVVPCYRCASSIYRAIESVASQSLLPSEIVLVDDFSDDGTLDHLYRLQGFYPEGWIRVIEQKRNGGPSVARNVGWNASVQPFVAFLDADDSWHPQKIEIQYLWMAKNSDVVLTGHGISISNEGQKCEIFDITKAPSFAVSRVKLLISNRFSTPTIMLRRQLRLRFDESKRWAEDYLLWLEVCMSNNKIYFIDYDLAYIHKAHFGEGGLSGELWEMEKGEIDTYRKLFSKGHLNIFGLLILCQLSLLKYFRRFFICYAKINSQ